MNRVRVLLNIKDGEYSLGITGILGSLDIDSPGGIDDISLIKECIFDYVTGKKELISGVYIVDLVETGEYEDIFWNKYYKVDQIQAAGE